MRVAKSHHEGIKEWPRRSALNTPSKCWFFQRIVICCNSTFKLYLEGIPGWIYLGPLVFAFPRSPQVDCRIQKENTSLWGCGRTARSVTSVTESLNGEFFFQMVCWNIPEHLKEMDTPIFPDSPISMTLKYVVKLIFYSCSRRWELILEIFAKICDRKLVQKGGRQFLGDLR